MDALLTSKDFPRWTKARLGLPLTASLEEEIDREIIRAEDHVRAIISDAKFDELAEDTEANANRRRRFQAAIHALVEAALHHSEAETLGQRSGSSTQGRRSRTIGPGAWRSARAASTRAYRHYVETMFHLGLTVRDTALGVYETRVRL